MIVVSIFFCLMLTIEALPIPCVPYNGTGFAILGVEYYYYHSLTNSLSFSDARTYCQNLHPSADLAILKYPENWDLLKNYISADKWIGVYQDASKQPIYEPDCNWTWVDGTSADGIVNPFLVSDSSEPNDSGSKEDCFFFSTGKGNGYTCNTAKPFICSIPGNSS
jgi:hypothetical protein